MVRRHLYIESVPGFVGTYCIESFNSSRLVMHVCVTIQWRHNEHDDVSNHRRLDCLLNRLFRRRSTKTSKLPVTGPFEGNPPVAGGFPSQRTRNVGNVSSWWVHHDDVIKWKHFPRNWPFVREIHRSPVNFPHKGQWRGALMFSLIYAWINDWVNNREAGDLRRQHGHYDVIVMIITGTDKGFGDDCSASSHYINRCWDFVDCKRDCTNFSEMICCDWDSWWSCNHITVVRWQPYRVNANEGDKT